MDELTGPVVPLSPAPGGWDSGTCVEAPAEPDDTAALAAYELAELERMITKALGTGAW